MQKDEFHGDSLPRTFRITFGRRLYVFLTSVPIVIFIAGILIALSMKGAGRNLFDVILIMIVILGNCLIFIPRFVEAFWTTVTIGGGKVARTVLWKHRQIDASDILGFEVNHDTNAIHLVGNGPDANIIILSVHLEDFLEISNWVKSEFRNLSAEQYESEFTDIFGSDRYGTDDRSRKQKFQIALLRARSINVAAIVVSLWTIMVPEPYDAAIIATALLPPIAVWALLVSRGLILLDSHSWRVPPTIAQAFLLPALALFLRAYTD